MRILKKQFLTPFWQYRTVLCIAIALGFAFCANAEVIVPGAARMDKYLPLLKGKRVALLVNQTSVVNGCHLIDTLLSRRVNIVKVFAPEHGYRGVADAGAHVANEADESTGLNVISLYGKNKKPSDAAMADIDVLIYDIQDVGVRFYTYISTLQYAMEACAANKKQLLLLDRPNPNGFYVDGPVLDTACRSFVGMQPIPVVYGMTPGEYAKMLVGEKWFAGAASLCLTVVSCINYTHDSHYHLPVSPSPNLRSDAAIYYYPSLCLFEGTVVSVGRGTDTPFQLWGAPAYKGSSLSDTFKPQAMTGATSPMYKDEVCYGEKLMTGFVRSTNAFTLSYLLKAWSLYPEKKKFFNPFFEKLAGTDMLRKQIESGATEQQIRASWKPALDRFKQIRARYLLYK